MYEKSKSHYLCSFLSTLFEEFNEFLEFNDVLSLLWTSSEISHIVRTLSTDGIGKPRKTRIVYSSKCDMRHILSSLEEFRFTVKTIKFPTLEDVTDFCYNLSEVWNTICRDVQYVEYDGNECQRPIIGICINPEEFISDPVASFLNPTTAVQSGSKTLFEANIVQTFSDHMDRSTNMSIYSHIEVIFTQCVRIRRGACRFCYALKSVYMSPCLRSIGWGAFRGCQALTHIECPPKLTEIYAYAFSDCFGLKSIRIGEELRLLDKGAFEHCYSLEEIHLPNGLRSVGSSAFRSCNALREVTFGDGLITIGEHAFNGCDHLTRIVLPQTVSAIGAYAFAGCSALEDIEIGPQVQLIAMAAFTQCASLRRIHVPDKVHCINAMTFSECTALETVTLGPKTRLILEESFHNCVSLRHIELPNSVRLIEKRAFYQCKALEGIVFGTNLREIGQECFGMCSGLRHIEIPENVSTIDRGAFASCTKLETFLVQKNMQYEGISDFSRYPFLKGCDNLRRVRRPPKGFRSIGPMFPANGSSNCSLC